MIWALKNRIKREMAASERDTWKKCLRGMKQDLQTYTDDLLHGRNTQIIGVEHPHVKFHLADTLQEYKHKVATPVSSEEIHVALMSLTSKLLKADYACDP